jgi:hypothetical protein
MSSREEQALQWIEDVTGCRNHGGAQIGDALLDGVALCHLANGLLPCSVPSISHSTEPWLQRENIESFLQAARFIGVQEYDLFSTPDLFECKNLKQVVNCLFALGKAAYHLPDYDGPCLGLASAARGHPQEQTRQYIDSMAQQKLEAVRAEVAALRLELGVGQLDSGGMWGASNDEQQEEQHEEEQEVIFPPEEHDVAFERLVRQHPEATVIDVNKVYTSAASRSAATSSHISLDDPQSTTKAQEVTEGVFLYTTQSMGAPPLIVTYRVGTTIEVRLCRVQTNATSRISAQANTIAMRIAACMDGPSIFRHMSVRRSSQPLHFPSRRAKMSC